MASSSSPSSGSPSSSDFSSYPGFSEALAANPFGQPALRLVYASDHIWVWADSDGTPLDCVPEEDFSRWLVHGFPSVLARRREARAIERLRIARLPRRNFTHLPNDLGIEL